jgi:hypothetical protein
VISIIIVRIFTTRLWYQKFIFLAGGQDSHGVM